ncbi:MAG: methionyl-tRNA formyltransferase [Balneolaceae bacterium]
MLNIVFMGSPEFALPSLEALHVSPHEIKAVATNPDRRRGRGGEKSPTVVKQRTVDLGYPVIEVDSTHDADFAGRLRELKPDLIVVVAFRILPPEVIGIPRLGSVNLHASLLPKYRGAAPIHWAIINGEEETGCSVFMLKDKVDTGDVLRQARTRIGPNETAGDLYERLKVLGAELLVETVDQIERGETGGVPQNDQEASPAPKLFTKDAKIDLAQPSVQVHDRIRGLSPFPGGWAEYGNMKLNLYRSRIGPDIDLEPGELLFAEGRHLLAGCSSGSVEITELQLPGKKRTSGRDFANGYNLAVRLT